MPAWLNDRFRAMARNNAWPNARVHWAPRRGIGLTHCPNCGARIVPTPRELKQWRKAANLSQRKIGALLKISAAHVAYLENGKQSPSAFAVLGD
jgi:DNA-binding XRE family transcriptional regulator